MDGSGEHTVERSYDDEVEAELFNPQRIWW